MGIRSSWRSGWRVIGSIAISRKKRTNNYSGERHMLEVGLLRCAQKGLVSSEVTQARANPTPLFNSTQLSICRAHARGWEVVFRRPLSLK